ncbi:hypothetical protein HZF05_09880 [Sphingomonas sp. CGMCC 1.13654]|uniref:Uncharacterized protein n=1 Tax=Sphingomonas chungangi TaxID=2683589 RepID=A0A838L5U2_9SPHN|nr:hypothetical protein [Sphingomonas chungangi]MBA2934407.1 hypothetical protein [Sphingomonas chungangi]MVW57446.1 hypothetical protein [Sphingomonas chungangi]
MRAGALLASFVGVVLLAWLAIIDPAAAADGWRAAFLLLSAVPVGAVVLLLIARVVGADWEAALQPLLGPLPWLGFLLIPVVAGQALFHWPAGHLHIWLSPLAFAIRAAFALLFWTWTARALACRPSVPAGPLLLAHGLVVSVMGYDWLLGVMPGQPNSAAPMILAVMQIGGAAAFACAAGLGTPAQRRDLAYLIVASGLGLAYLLYIDFAIVWFGNLPAHVGWYVQRGIMPAALLPGLALALGLLGPILLVGIGRSEPARRQAGLLALLGLGLTIVWVAAGPTGWLGLLAAFAGVLAIGGLARGAVA